MGITAFKRIAGAALVAALRATPIPDKPE